MEKEKTEQAAIELCTTEGQEEWVKDYGVSCFKDGARWRINSAWHDEKEMPDREELVFCEICRNGEKAYLPLQWEADGKMTVDIPFLGGL